MSDSVIKIENMGKRYVISHQRRQRSQYSSLSELMTNFARGVGRKLRPNAAVHASEGGRYEEFWALRDIDLDVRQGDTVGIIGHNGAGKSTLLKILSRITEPTTGRIRIKGRVASLLEVGTGFHPEMSGRENIYLNGSILGMSKSEIRKKFDEIVDFAEIEQFLDTPVKRYSSGMYVRLAFAVAAHLEPEILVVDEVLAVGDIKFQKKCLGKMSDVTQKEGRTILFVSHNMATLQALCSRGVLLKKGQVVMEGSAEEAVTTYQKSLLEQTKEEDFSDKEYRSEIVPAGFRNIRADLIEQEDGDVDLTLAMDVFAEQRFRRLEIGLEFVTLHGVRAAYFHPTMTTYGIDEAEGTSRVEFTFPRIGRYLAGGEYYISLLMGRAGERLLFAENAVNITIPPRDFFRSGVYFNQDTFGIVPMPIQFRIADAEGENLEEALPNIPHIAS